MDGSLIFNGRQLRLTDISDWQQADWESSLKIGLTSGAEESLQPIDALNILLGSLGGDRWVAPDQLKPAFKVLCFGIKSSGVSDICRKGWQKGCLARIVDGEITSYRLPVEMKLAPSKFEDFLSLNPNGDLLQIDSRKIPLDVLESLNQLAYLEWKSRQFTARLDPVKLGRATHEVRQSALGQWLAEQTADFGKIFEEVENRWGKTIVHHNLLIARVRDLSLRVQLERGLKNDLILLSDEFVAFPYSLRSQVERILQKEGFVVRTVVNK